MKEDTLQLDQSISSTMKDHFLRSDTCSQCGNSSISATSSQAFDIPLTFPKGKSIDAGNKRAVIAALRESQPKFCSAEGTVARLLMFERRRKEKRKVQALLSREKEKKMLREKPEICVLSKQMSESRNHIPIYSQERINQIEQARREKLEKIKKEICEEKRVLDEAFERQEHTKDRLHRVKEKKLCFDPSKVTSLLYKTMAIPNSCRKTSEEQELQYCSFRPKTNKKSSELTTKADSPKKPVVQRLLDYEKSRKYVMKQRVKESEPSFRLETNKKKSGC
eukprot:TRINITY_DN9568_c0_g3_i2.p1 TRINITY_DN9568_c0_g3~~TRINITY_DN9568_c0_g3_i2.p1  ORF type:complete len:308 (-),score=75.82 TRINITY_DN9568_c0_g3_i2:55-891(-)